MCAKRRSGRWGGHAECAGGVHGAFFVCCVLTTRSCGKSLATTHYIRLTTTYYLLLTTYHKELREEFGNAHPQRQHHVLDETCTGG